MRLFIALVALAVMLSVPAWAGGIGAADEDILPDGVQPMDKPLIEPAPAPPSSAMPQFTAPVRVLLSSRAAQVQVDCKGAVNVWDVQGRALGKLAPPVTIVLAGSSVKARDAAGGFTAKSLTLAPADGSSLLGYKGRSYRGCFRAAPAMEGGVLLLNVLGLEDYLRGVVPSEMPAKWHPEAVKAQAVAARTYVLKRTAVNRSAQYDVTADVNDQVYLGQSKEHPASDAAIKATEGIVAAYNGQPITAYYHSSGGGRTRKGTEPYLAGVESPEESPYNDWVLEYSLDELSAILAKGGQRVGRIAYVRHVAVAEERDGFRVEFIGDGATKQLTAISVRKLLGINTCRSPNFKVETLTDILDALAPLDGSLKVLVRGSEREEYVKVGSAYAIGAESMGKVTGANVLARQPKPSKVRIVGHGYGHGLGMSQYGAKFMAERGADWKAIILHYYTGVQVVNISELKLP